MADFERLIRKLGRMVAARVAEVLSVKRKKSGWVSAFIEARWFSDTDSPSWTSKLRVDLSTGKRFGVETTTEIEDLLGHIWARKGTLFPDSWWGLKLTVF